MKVICHHLCPILFVHVPVHVPLFIYRPAGFQRFCTAVAQTEHESCKKQDGGSVEGLYVKVVFSSVFILIAIFAEL